jgi:predicted DNA-binding protein
LVEVFALARVVEELDDFLVSLVAAAAAVPVEERFVVVEAVEEEVEEVEDFYDLPLPAADHA